MTARLAAGEFQFVIVRCGEGQVATGGGFGSDSSLVTFSENSPAPSDGIPTAWVVGARNNSETVSGIQVVAYVICAPASTH